MLGGNHEVFHARAGCCRRPQVGLIQVRVKVFEIGVVDLIRDLFVVLHPLMPRGQGIQAPVNEQAEAVMHEPAGVAGCLP